MCRGIRLAGEKFARRAHAEYPGSFGKWERAASVNARRFAWPLLAVAVLGVSGCGHKEESHYSTVSKPPTVQVMHPEVRRIVRVIGQPSFIESYEHTAVYPKLVGYIEKWNVDIGDKVKKDQVLAKLFVPELVEDFGTKKATVKLDEERVELARKVVMVATADLKAARARLDEAKAILAKYQSEVDRWATEIKRLDHEVKRGVVDPQILLESTNQWRSSIASRDAAKATIEKADAEVLSKDASLAKARVDVSVAQADLSVAISEAKRIEAWVGYITLTAPFDGVIVERAANTGDFVMPATGDPSAMPRTPHMSPGGTAAPIYVVDRLDVVRIFVDVPERDANYVTVGTKASVLVQAFRDEPLEGEVTRTSWALNAKSRTLRAEVDLPNPRSQLLPGMYAYAKVIIDRPGVRALPVSALTHSGEKSYVWTYKDGHAVRMEVRTGITDGDWIEVTSLERPSAAKYENAWTPVNGSEQVIVGDLSVLADGGPVNAVSASNGAKVASAERTNAGVAESHAGASGRVH
jgi:multidrug efflux pump subunit AcrA (membrane-fusion protein)